jgi:hypothetical protein
VTDRLHVDATLVAANRMIELQVENEQLKEAWTRMSQTIEQLRAKLAEYELLLAVAIHTDDFLQKLLDGLAHQLPEGTPRSVDGIVAAVADMALKFDAHEDASTPAFDEIAKLCGRPEWEYPGQVVRDVERVVKERDELVDATILGPLKGKSMHDEILSLRERLRVAEAVRDDARAASQRDLEARRNPQSPALPGVTDEDLDEAIRQTDMHADEYGELERALVILRLLKNNRRKP